MAGEEGTISFLRLVPASEGFFIESVMASSFPVDWWGANFGDGADTCRVILYSFQLSRFRWFGSLGF